MKKKMKIYTIPIIIVLITSSVGCDQSADKKNLDEKLADINARTWQNLQQMDQLIYDTNAYSFRNKTKKILDSIDNQIEQYHLLMDRNNQLINKEVRDHIIGFKQKKVEMEFKLALLEHSGAYMKETGRLTHSDTVITIRNASGSAVTHDIELPETDKTEIIAERDTVLLNQRLNEWQYAGINLRKELLNDMQEIKKEVELFLKKNM
jgi:hypothetical protein